MTKDAVIVSAQVPAQTRVELERRAEAGYRSVSAEIRLALDAHLSRGTAAKPRQEAGQRGLASSTVPE